MAGSILEAVCLMWALNQHLSGLFSACRRLWSPYVRVCYTPHIYKHTHTYTHTIHTCTRTYTCIHTYTYPPLYTHTCPHIHVHAYTQPTHTHLHTHPSLPYSLTVGTREIRSLYFHFNSLMIWIPLLSHCALVNKPNILLLNYVIFSQERVI